VDGLWATKSEDVGLIVRAISFQDFQRFKRTDRQTERDRRTDDMQSQNRAMHYSASRGKKGGIFPETRCSLSLTDMLFSSTCLPKTYY